MPRTTSFHTFQIYNPPFQNPIPAYPLYSTLCPKKLSFYRNSEFLMWHRGLPADCLGIVFRLQFQQSFRSDFLFKIILLPCLYKWESNGTFFKTTVFFQAPAKRMGSGISKTVPDMA